VVIWHYIAAAAGYTHSSKINWYDLNHSFASRSV